MERKKEGWMDRAEIGLGMEKKEGEISVTDGTIRRRRERI
jgi:hypothetical protein